MCLFLVNNFVSVAILINIGYLSGPQKQTLVWGFVKGGSSFISSIVFISGSTSLSVEERAMYSDSDVLSTILI